MQEGERNQITLTSHLESLVVSDHQANKKDVTNKRSIKSFDNELFEISTVNFANFQQKIEQIEK